jgi:hypothetical protein
VTSPESIAVSNAPTNFETPPEEVMMTTITTLGCSVNTSMRRIVALSTAGAVATASRFVISDSVSVVTRSASSSSRRTWVKSSAAIGPRCSGAASRRSTR